MLVTGNDSQGLHATSATGICIPNDTVVQHNTPIVSYTKCATTWCIKQKLKLSCVNVGADKQIDKACLGDLLEGRAAVGWGNGWHAPQLLQSSISLKKLLTPCTHTQCPSVTHMTTLACW